MRPRGWTVIGSGPLADEVRAEIARDPEAYLPETWSMKPVGRCPCCNERVYRCTTRHTGWQPGFATHSGKVHPAVDASGNPTPAGAIAGCCCVAPNWGPKHGAKTRKSTRRSR